MAAICEGSLGVKYPFFFVWSFEPFTLTNASQNIHQTLISWFKSYILNENTMQYMVFVRVIATSHGHTKRKMVVVFFADCARLASFHETWDLFSTFLFWKGILDMVTELASLTPFLSRTFDRQCLYSSRMLVVSNSLWKHPCSSMWSTSFLGQENDPMLIQEMVLWTDSTVGFLS